MAAYEHMQTGNDHAVADFRSDTVTRASLAMRRAMADADVGDDVHGEDPTVNRLQELVAERTGKEAALFVTSATQSNLVAVLSHCGRGDEYLVGSKYHVFDSEAGGTAALGGVVPYAMEVDSLGGISTEQIRDGVKPDDPHYPITRLLCVENTVSGSVQASEHIDELGATARELGLKVHLDGSRLFNAAVATGVAISAFLDQVDTVTLCMSKGLGAPLGAVLAGDAQTIGRAHRIRKLVGGATRQIGHMAAAAMYALEHNVDRLGTDHRNAARLAEGIEALDGLSARHATNMVFVSTATEHRRPLVAHLRAQGLLVSGFEPDLRLVCHLDVDSSDVDQLVKAFASYPV